MNDNEKEALISSASYSQKSDASYYSVESKSDDGSKKKLGFLGLFRFASNFDKFLMICGTFFSVAHGAGWPILAIIFGQMTNVFLRADNSDFLHASAPDVPLAKGNSSIPPVSRDEYLDAVVQYSIYYALVGVGMFIASYAQVACWSAACTNQVHRLRKAFFKAILRQEITWYDKNQSGEMTARLNDDLERIREGIGDKFSMFLQYASAFVSGFVIGFIFSWKLTLVMMSLTPLLALSGAFIAKIIASHSTREQEKYAKAAGVAEEVISCIRTVLSFNGQKREIQRYKNALMEGRALGLRKYAYMGAGLLCTFVVMYATYALAFWYGSVLILDDPNFPRGTIFTVFFAVMLGSSSLGQAAPHLSSLATSKGAAVKIYEIIDAEPKIDPYSYAGQRPQHIKGKIEFNKVRFSYPVRKNVKVLNGISLRVEPAQKVALVGASGCGKSTIINLLLRYYDALKGKITIDGYDISQLNLHWLRNLIGVVSQEPVLFDGTIEENIRLGSQDVTKEAIIEAAKMANAYHFIEQLPHKFDTRTGERGVQLSGGQKQRIAIARALIRNPKILLLDEATSALDAESEGVVQEALNKAQEGRTTIAVAHRLSTIKGYDWIYVFESGFVVEQGKHAELMEKKGLYYKMVLSQQLDEPDSDVGSGSEQNQSATTDTEVAKLESDMSSPKKSRTFSRQLSQRRKSYISQTSTTHMADTSEFNRLNKELKEEKAEKVGWFDIINENKAQWGWLISGIVGATISGTIMPCFALFYSQIFGVYSKDGEELRQGGIFWSLMFLVLGFAQGIGFYMSCYSFGQTGESLTMGLRLKVFSNLVRQDVTYFDDELHSTGKICTRLATDAPNVKAAVGFRISSVFTATMAMIAAIIIAFVFGWKLALVVMAMLPLMIVSGFLSFKLHVNNQARDIKLLEAAGKISSEAIGNIRTVQALCRESHFYFEYCKQLENPYKESLKQDQVKALGFAFSQSVVFFMYAAAFRFGGSLVANGEMEALNVYRVFFAIAFCGLSFGESSSFIPDYVKARMSASLLFQMIRLEPKIDNCSTAGLKPEFKGTIGFKSVYFTYPTRADVPVLQGLSFTVKPGKTLALIGSSGCGKSTVVSLIQRFYDPIHGQILIDGYDLRSLNLPHFRNHVATVSQEPILFDCSIRDNIVYGLESNVTHEQIVQSAKLANIHEFILNLPQGYNTLVGEKGTQLSGGQKQRVAIARALVREPKILLLDEATSALDTESEKLVQEALDKAREGRTCIMIAHRLSTVQNSDYIAVVKEGKIIEKGTHSELITQKGLYFKMTQMQNLIDT